MALTGSRDGAEALLGAVADGKSPGPRAARAGIHDRLSAAGVRDLDRGMKLATAASPAKEELTKLIAERAVSSRRPSSPSSAKRFREELASSAIQSMAKAPWWARSSQDVRSAELTACWRMCSTESQRRPRVPLQQRHPQDGV
jgi:hypothetical protein